MENFRDRLDAVNKELSDILNHNATVKEQLTDARGRRTNDMYAEVYGHGKAGPSPTTGYGGIVAAKMGYRGPSSAPTAADGGMNNTNNNTTSSSAAIEHTFAAAAAPSSPHRHNAAAGGHQPITTSHDLMRREVREVVMAEMQHQTAALHGIVAREWDLKMRDVDAVLRGRFGELRSANEGLQRVVTELADEVGHVNETLGNRIDRLEGDISRKINAIKREHDETIRQLREEIRDLTETMLSAKLDANSLEKRSEELGRRLQDNITATHREFEQKWNTFEDHVEATLRNERKQQTVFTDRVEKALVDHSTQIAADGNKLQQLQKELTAVGEEAVGMRSQMRLTRGELNQLEMLVRSVSVRQQAAAGVSGAAAGGKGLHLDPLALNQPAGGGKQSAAATADGNGKTPTAQQQRDEAPWFAGALPFGEGIRLQQDVYALKQSVAYLADVVERRLLNTTNTSNSRSNESGGHNTHRYRSGGSRGGSPTLGASYLSKHHQSPQQSFNTSLKSPAKYRVPDSDEESNARLARSSID